MNISTSPDISELSVKVNWDISGALPKIILTNESTGGNLAACDWAFVAKSPSQTLIHEGDIDNPDITGNWTAHTLSDSWPRPYNQIEWSGAPYSFFVIVKDSTGQTYTAPVQYTEICRPFGNAENAKNTFGIATSQVKVKCQDANVYFQDTTYHTYKGDSGTQYSSVLRVIYPIDETLVIPDPFVAAQYVTALVPISYSSTNYQFVQTVIYDYAIGDNSVVRIKYQTIQTFPVFCNVDLLPLVCEINKLLDEVESGSCANIVEASRKMNLVVGKFALVMIGIEQPLTGVDVPALIDEIIAIGGFDCTCCTAATGIIPTAASVISGYNFIVNKLGGDVAGNFSTNGNNITLNISDVSYVVAIGNRSPSTISAFSVTPVVSGDGFLKTYYINIDGIQLATDILNIIKSNSALVTLFNSIVNNNGGGFELVVNMNCIGTITDACDYEFGLESIPASPTNAFLYQIRSSIPGNQRLVNFAFNLSNLPALQVYLNSLGVGTFVVTNQGGGKVLITSSTNSYSLTGIVYASGLTKKFATFTSDCTGFVSKSANQVVQAIIDYLCGITDNQMVTSQDYVICSVDPISKLKVLTNVPAGTKENILIAEILDKGCDTVDYLLSIAGVNCAAMQALFPAKPTLIMQNTDYIFGTKAGQCAGISPVEAATRMLQLGVYNAEFMAAFCAAVALCAGGYSCDPYEVFQVAVVNDSPTVNKITLAVTFTHPAAIKNTIRYARIDNTPTPVYTTIPNVLPGDSPYLIPNLDDGQYFVGITPIYADGRACAEVSTNTPSCNGGITAFNAVIDGSGNIVVSYAAIGSIEKVQVVINYPSGGTSKTDHTNTGSDITIAPPEGVTGDYFITLVPICNVATGFKGQATAPVILSVNPANNSTLNNNTSNTLSPISMVVYSIDQGQYITIFNQPSVGASGVLNFYLADGSYNKAQITFPTGAVGNAYLISSSGTMIGDVVSGQVVFNGAADTFVSSGGIQIVFIDPSPAV